MKQAALTDIFVKRPVLATVISLVILLSGLIAYKKLPVRQFPQMSASVISIDTSFEGASAKLMEGFITTPIENALSGIEGLDFITSNSTQGNSSISVHLKLGSDLNKAVTDISDKVAAVRSSLPDGIHAPIISRKDPNAQASLYIVFDSRTLTAEKISDYLSRSVLPQISNLPGVAEVSIYGEKKYAMRLWLDPHLMAAHKVTASDLQRALKENNVQSVAGTISNNWQEFNVTALTDLRNVKEFNNMVIRTKGDRSVRFQDVGYAELAAADTKVTSILNGKPARVLAIVAKPTANPLDVSKAVKQTFPRIKAQLPKGLSGYIIWDNSKFIKASITEVYWTIGLAIVFVIIVIFIFLGSLRSVLIPVTTIPLSLFGVCVFMLMMGYSINTITLLAWVLAVGLVVDDAIVVVENIHRHIEAGHAPMQAAIMGAREIRFAVIAMTLTLATVYTPIGFVQGFVGSLFREFAFSLAGAVVVSGVIALTLSPMMCAKLIRPQKKESIATKLDAIFERFSSQYKRLLTWTLSKRLLIIVLALLVYGGCYFLYSSTAHELAPQEDQSFILGMASGPASANLSYMEHYTQQLPEIYKTVPEVLGYGIINGIPNGVNSALTFAVLKPWAMRKRSASQIVQTLQGKVMAIPGIRLFMMMPPTLPGASGFMPVAFEIKTTESYEKLAKVVEAFKKRVQQNPRLVNIDVNLKFDKPEFQVEIDREKAATLGVSMNAITQSLNLMLGEPIASRFVMNGRSYDVLPELQPQFRMNPESLKYISVRTLTGKLVSLSNLIHVSEHVVPQGLRHFQQMRVAKLSAALTPGYTLGQALTFLEETAKQVFPAQVQYDFSGQSRQFIAASSTMAFTFGAALLFIFLVLAAQFESFRDPFIVMLSVPLSITGALLAMHLTGSSLNIYTQIGLVTLVGLISKHGILMVEFANQQQKQGLDKLEAIIASASLRLRPILMTTFAMVISALPLALSTGAGAEVRQQIGWVIIGGMGFGTVLTLFVVPTAYLLLAKKHA